MTPIFGCMTSIRGANPTDPGDKAGGSISIKVAVARGAEPTDSSAPMMSIVSGVWGLGPGIFWKAVIPTRVSVPVRLGLNVCSRSIAPLTSHKVLKWSYPLDWSRSGGNGWLSVCPTVGVKGNDARQVSGAILPSLLNDRGPQ